MGAILDGKALAFELQNKLAGRVQNLTEQLGRHPGLGVIVVGSDPASAVYVNNKEKAASKVGIVSKVVRLNGGCQQEEIEKAIDSLNACEEIDGFLLQLPLPAGLVAHKLLARIRPDKDADGLHPLNLGRLAAGLPGPRPCTPLGILALLKKAAVPVEAARTVVIGRSTIVGKPLALMLLAQNATVTVCHSYTRNLDELVRESEIVVAAVGKPNLISGDWIRKGATVIDVGTTWGSSGWQGDVDFAGCLAKAAFVSPVPGGVGPLTVTMLLQNTVDLAEERLSSR